MSVNTAVHVTPMFDAAHAPKPKTWFDGELIDSDALQANFLQRLLHLVQLEGLNDGLDLLHFIQSP